MKYAMFNLINVNLPINPLAGCASLKRSPFTSFFLTNIFLYKFRLDTSQIKGTFT